MKKFTNFNFGDSRMDREWTEVEPRMDRSTLATMCRYIAMIFAVLVMSVANVGMAWGETITMSSIFTGSNTSATITSPLNATVSTTTSASNAGNSKLGSDGNYFQIVLTDKTFSAASINGYINSDSNTKNWGFQFTTNGGKTWGSEVTQANDGTKSAHDINVGVTIPSGANGIRIIRKAGTATYVYSITLTLAASSARTFKSGQTIFFKDASGNISGLSCLWKVSDSGKGNIYAYFWNDTEGAWSTYGDKVSGNWNEANAIYKFTVPGSGKEYTKVKFTRGTAATLETGSGWYGQQTADQTPEVGKNMYIQNTSAAVSSRYNGSWAKYAPDPALIGDFNNWDPDANVFGDYDGNVGVTYFTLDETSHTYGFKILQGETYYSFDNNGGGWTLTATRTSEQQLYDNNGNSNITSTTEVGEYAMKYDKSSHKFKALYYPDERLTKNTILYFDGRRETNWQDAPYHTKFYFKKYDSDTEISYLFSENPVESWVYYVTVPNNDKVGKVQLMRMNPSNHGQEWCYNNLVHVNTRSSSLQNCLTEEVGNESACSPWTPGWTIYCPPTTSETFTDNSTSVIAGTSGDGTSGSPYLVPTTGTINVQASASKAVNDGNMTINYDFKVDDSSAQPGEGNTYSKGSLSNNTTYKMSVDVYTVYNLDDSKNSTKHTPTALYYKALDVYTISYNRGSNGTGDNTTAEKIYGISKTLLGATFTRTGYTQTAWNTNSAGTGGTSYTLSGSYTANSNVTLYPTWTAKTTTVTLNPNTANHGTGSNVVITATYDAALSSFSAAIPAAGYSLKGYYTDATGGTKVINADGTFSANSGIWNRTDGATLTLYAQYELAYTVTYDKNGATSGTAPSDGSSPYSSGATVTVKDTTGCKFVYSGHVFRGWNTANDGSGDYYAPGDKFTISGNTTLYAVWVEGTKGTVTYNLETNSSSTTLDNCKSATPTSGNLIASTTINTYGTADCDGSASAKTDETQKLKIDAEYTAANYYEWTCAIGSSVTFVPSQVVIKFQAVSGLTQYKVVLTDGTTSYNTNFVQTTSAGGTLETLTWNIADGNAFASSSTMKLQLWAYKKESKATAFRLGSPILINGVVGTAACTTPAAPSGLTNGATTANTQVVTWTANGEDKWEVYHSTSSSTPGTDQTPTATVNSATYTFTGLTASTQYYWWARAKCDATHKSAWVAGTSFTTSAGTYTISMGAVTTNQPSGSTVGGTISASAASAAAGTTITLTATPTSADYVHTSWTVTKASSGTVEVSNNQFTMPAEAVTVTATFTRKYSITYLEDDNTTGIDGLSPTYYLYGVGATLPTPTKSGYTFADWYSQWCVFEDDEAPEGPGYGWVDGCKVSTISTTDYGNATYLAKWTANQYSVSHSLSDVTATSGATGANAATYGTNYTAVFAAAGVYTLPATITVTIGGEATSHYTWNSSTGEVVVDGDYILGAVVITITGESEGCTPQTVSKVVVTGSSAGTTSGYNEKEYVGTPVISVNGKAADTTNIDGVSGKVTGYKMSDNGTSIVFATLGKGTFQEGDVVKIGITRRNDTRVISSNKNVLTIYYGTNKDNADSLTTISTGSTTTSGALEHEGAGFYTYTLTAADVTKIGSKKGIGLFRESSNGENPYVYSVEIIGCRDWTTCTAPTAVSAGTITSNGATFTITDAENTLNYELYISESSTDPTADATPTATSSSKTKVVSSLSASTTYYYWVRSNCGGYKSEWVAGASTFTTLAAATTYRVTYDDNGKTGGSVPTDAGSYENGDVVTVLGNTGSLVKTGYTFVGWSTNSTPASGTFYPAGYKFTMGTANVTLYAVWASGSSTCITITDFDTSSSNKTKDNHPDSEGKYFFGYKGTKDAAHAVTITATNGDCIGQNSGANMKVYGGKYVNIYADNTSTGGTPATFSNVTSVSFKAKVLNASYIATFDVMVGSTTIADNISLEDATSSFQTYSYSGLNNLSGKIKIINNNSSSSSYSFLVDDIEICTGSGASLGYSVTFDKQDKGGDDIVISNVPSGSKIGAPIPAPTATGYSFGGWYKEVGCSNAWDFATGTITADKTLYAKWTSCAPVISADPSGTSYNQNAVATALSVTATGDDLTYQWYSNEENSNSDGTEIPGATSASYTPSTALVGTIYYYCVVTNDCGNATSAVAAITVNDAKDDPTATWTVATPTHGGKGFSFSVTAYKHDGSTAWDGTLTAAMLSASEDVVLSGVTVTDNTISGTYGVKASATSPVTFYLELPSTTTQAAATLSKEQTFSACVGGDLGSALKVPVNAKYEDKATGKPDYRCEGDYGYISPDLGASSVSLASHEYGDEFDYYINQGRGSVLIGTKVANVKKIQIYLNASSGAANVTNVYIASSYSKALKDYTELTAKSDYSVSYMNSNGEDETISKGEDGYIELEFTTGMDNGTQVYVVLKNNAKYYGAKLFTATSSGSITTALAWSNSQANGATVEKGEDDPEFTITANRSGAPANASLGTIHYSSSDTKIATVGALTGRVSIADAIDFGEDKFKTTTITATLMNSGCYKSAAITYTLKVTKSECTEAAGTVTAEDLGCTGIRLTVSDYEAGATIQWYKDGASLGSSYQAATCTVTVAGTYTAITHNTCDRTSNSVVVERATASASKIVDSWYVKNGRRTPDIALVQTEGATGFTVTSGGSPLSNIGGCTFELKEDGIIYLHGTKSNGDAPSDMTAGDQTITITATACGGNASALDITIHKQAETLKPSIAFVVDGTTRAKGGTATSVSTAKTSERPLWTYLSSTFSLTGCNIYWSVDSKELREYYSQYDAIVVTDDPNTQTKGAGDVEYVKAFGTLVDVRPILTMEAYVGRYTDGGWHVYNATPTSPNPRQVEMKLECKNHEIFSGVSDASDNVRTVTVNGDDYWYITIVDTTLSPYKGTTKDYKDLPALQGFDPSSFSDMLGIGTIKEDELQAGVERQEEPAARMMILGIQNNAMGALTNEGKLIIKNALSYLLKTNMEEVDDCSNYFTGATNTDWNTASNWSKNNIPDFTTKVRIMAPVVITSGQKVRAAQVDVVVGGESSKKDGTPNGHITINPGGALIVSGTVNLAKAPNYGIDDLKPTTDENLSIQANSSNNAALILDNSSGLTGATVQMYSSSFWEESGDYKTKYWSYVAVPIQEALIPDYFLGAFTYYYVEKDGWKKKWDGDYLYPFQAIGLSRDNPGIEYFWGPLVSTENRDIKLTKSAIGGGENLIANSWTAPIQIANFDTDDFGDATATVYIYNTGAKGAYAGTTVVNADTENQGSFTAGQWLGIPIGVAKLSEYTGLKVIPAMQTFEVDMPAGAAQGDETTLHLDYDRLVRGVDVSKDNLTEKLHAPKQRMSKNDGDVEAVMKVRVAGIHTLAEVWLIQDGAFSEGFDNGWEAYYAPCDNRSPQLYAHSEVGNMGIIAKPELEGTILGFAPSRDGADYTFSFYYRGDEELYLNDLLTETSTLITSDATYSFTSSENGNGSRFIISRNPYQMPQNPTGTETVTDEQQDKVMKFIYNDKLYILYRGMIYDANGKLINRK